MTIPASAIVKINPGVIGGGGNPLSLNGVILSNDAATPLGTVQPFSSADAVGAFYGLASPEKSMADNYFNGYDNSTQKPSVLFFSQYAAADVSGYLRGATLGAMTLAQLQALSGVLTVSVDGTPYTSSSVNLSTATSFSDAATKIAAGFTGLPAVVAYDSQRKAFTVTSNSKGAGAAFTGAIATTTLTVSALASGKLGIGSVISGTGVTAGTTITALGTGTGGVGTYTVGTSQTAASTAMTAAPSTVGYASGSLSAGLLMTQAAGAVLSAGALASTPGAAMDAVKAATLNWATFGSTFEPVLADKQLFAAWAVGQNLRFAYVCWDTDATALQSGNSSAFGPLMKAANVSCVFPITGQASVATALGTTLAAMVRAQAAFVMGATASIDFQRTNARITYAFKSQAGLVASVTDETIGAILIANGYNFYGGYATANQPFVFLYPGSVPGSYSFFDEFINQVWLNNALQLAFMSLLAQSPSIPYNAQGYSLIDAAAMDPVNAALNFGAIRTGVPLSAAQIAQVNAAAGTPIDTVLATRGWYLQIKPATAQIRALRGTPPMSFWYMDGGAVQQIIMASIVIQ